MAEVNDYINSFPEDTQWILIQIRKIILQEVPDAIESISYKMPAYKISGKPLIYFAGFKNHIGLYVLPQFIPNLKMNYQDISMVKDQYNSR